MLRARGCIAKCLQLWCPPVANARGVVHCLVADANHRGPVRTFRGECALGDRVVSACRAQCGGVAVGIDGECPGEAPAVMLVSLSGGVDSMVLTHALLRLRRAAAAPFEVHAVHIDYDNRVRRCAARTLDYA